jgi:uncharacterized membrane protein (UPF0127 family)
MLHTRRAALLLLVIGIAGFLVVGANSPANPELVPPLGIVKDSSLKAFGAVNVAVVPRPGLAPKPTPRCALLASTPALRSRGLMGQHSLDAFAGMVFTWPAASTARFSMKDTPLPLSIAWFDGKGRFLGSANMPSCPARVTTCPTYGPNKPYRLAIEVPRGGLPGLGIGPGSVMHLAGPCVG